MNKPTKQSFVRTKSKTYGASFGVRTVPDYRYLAQHLPEGPRDIVLTFFPKHFKGLDDYTFYFKGLPLNLSDRPTSCCKAITAKLRGDHYEIPMLDLKQNIELVIKQGRTNMVDSLGTFTLGEAIEQFWGAKNREVLVMTLGEMFNPRKKLSCKIKSPVIPLDDCVQKY